MPDLFLHFTITSELWTNWHGFCGKCQDKLDKCPQWTEPLSSNTSKNVLLISILDLLPHKCRYDGCQVFFTTDDHHEKWCGYQPTSCKLNDCKWTGCAKDVQDHITGNHDKTKIMKERNVKWYYCGFLSATISTPIFAYGHFFGWLEEVLKKWLSFYTLGLCSKQEDEELIKDNARFWRM